MPENKQNQDKNTKRKSNPGKGLFEMFDSNSLLNNAQKVISTAVNVLEEEIAAGILAAKNIEKKIIDVDGIRNDPENLMNRIRRDTHEALDIFLDAFASLSKQLGILTDTVAKKSENAHPESQAQNKPVNSHVIEHDETVKAGQKITMHISLQDDAITKPVKLDLQITNFTGPGTQKILSRFVQIIPESVLLKPGEVKEIAIKITVPANCKPGHYYSLLLVSQMPLIKNIITLQVI